MIRSTWKLLSRLMLKPVKQLLIVSFFATLAGMAEAAVLVLIVRTAVDAVGQPTASATIPLINVVGSTEQLLWVAGGLAVFVLALHSFVARSTASISSDVLAAARARAIDAYINARWTRQAAEPEGAFQETVSNLASQSSLVALSFVSGVTSILNLITLLIVAFLVNALATLAVVGVGVFLLMILRPLSNTTHRHSNRFVLSNSDFAEAAGRTAGMSMEIGLFGVRQAAVSELHEANRSVADHQYRMRFASRFGATLYRDLAVLLLVGTVAAFHVAGGTSVVGIGTVVILIIRALSSAQLVQSSLQTLNEQTPNLHLLDQRLSSLEADRISFGSQVLPGIARIELRDVGYRYPNSETDAVSAMTFCVEPGEVIGVVGPSGGGKSTLIEVLVRLRLPRSGTLTVGGTSYVDVADADWTRAVALVPQEPQLMAASVRDNIAFFRPDIQQLDVEAAARAAHIDQDIRAMADGYDTMLGPRGWGLSGGQKQRVAIARALAGGPQLLVLDEPSSALDVEAEALLQETILDLKRNITVIIVAHRMQTLKCCDRLLTIRDGLLESSDSMRGALEPNA